MSKPTTFHYFAYGSNLCAHRLALSSPSLKKIGIGKLQNYAMAFAYNSKRWNGGVATIHRSEDDGHCVWGIIWEIDRTDLPALDDQEGVAKQVYCPLEVTAVTPMGECIKCRTYQLTDLGGKHEFTDPSPQYHQLILEGAMDNDFPEDYVKMLTHVRTNGNAEITATMNMVTERKRQSQQ